MPRHAPFLLAALVALAACADREPSPTASSGPPPAPPTGERPAAAATPRERLAERLARALAEPTTRALFARRLATSHAPEGKVQFQALLHADQRLLLARLASQEGGGTAALLADLDAARGLELYLPVAAHRAAWHGERDLLVATVARDGERPVAFDVDGRRTLLDATTPPSTPVLALVPQETDFTGGRPELAMTCWDECSGSGSGGSGGTPMAGPPANSGLYLTQSHFDDDYESWIKGQPEFEYHVYGLGDDGQSTQLACTGDRSSGDYAWDQNDRDWSGRAMLFSAGERAAYEARHPNAPIRIMAWEDDDEACVPRVDTVRLTTLLNAIDAAYKAITSGKIEPGFWRGIKAAPTVFALLKAIRNALVTSDDFIGSAVETSVAGAAPGGANWVLKGEGMRTTGWFSTEWK